jgi:hypothetical protein
MDSRNGVPGTRQSIHDELVRQSGTEYHSPPLHGAGVALPPVPFTMSQFASRADYDEAVAKWRMGYEVLVPARGVEVVDRETFSPRAADSASNGQEGRGR